MARVFVRLKLTLLANGFRRGWQQALGIVIGTIYALPLAVGAAWGIARAGRRASPSVAEPLLIVGLAVLWLAWLVGPLLAFGMDETLNPGRLRLLPLRRRDLMRGLLAASCIGIAPVATVIVLYGVLMGFLPAGAGAVVVLLGVVAMFLLCITTARAVTTALSRRLTSRRGRDVLTIAAAMFGLLVAIAAQAPQLLVGPGQEPSVGQLRALLGRVGDVLSVLPPAWAARAIAGGARGDLLYGMSWLLPVLAMIALMLWWWSRSIDGMLNAGAAVTTAARDEDLFPAGLRWLPKTRLWAGVAKDLRYAWRVPQLRVQYLMVFLVAVPFSIFAIRGVLAPAALLLAPLLQLLLGTTGFNMFGGDRGAVWLLDVTGPDPRADLTGKSIVAAGVGVPLTVAIATALAANTGGWSYLPAAVLLALAVQGIVTATGMFVSVYAPFPLPDTPTNVFTANAGAGCTAMLLQSLGLFIEMLLVAPIAIAAGLAVLRSPAAVTVAAGAGVVWGLGAWLLALRLAAARLRDRGPEFVAALQPRAG